MTAHTDKESGATPRTDALIDKLRAKTDRSEVWNADDVSEMWRHAREMEILAKRWREIADKRAIEVADLETAHSAGVSSLPVTQCLTAGVSNSVTAGERLVCAECGCGNFIQMRLFPYDFHTEADYPEEHPDRCRKLDDTFYEPPIMEDGKSRPHWRCYKKVGHDSTNGGRHCSTHRDCGARIEGSGRCGLEPGHDNGIHEGDGPYTSTRSAIKGRRDVLIEMIELAWRELTAGRITKREQTAINDRAITDYNLGSPDSRGPDHG